MWRTKVFQYPRARAAQKRDLAESGDLMFVNVLLIFLSPSLRCRAMKSLLGIAAEFAHDHRLVVGRGPSGDVQIGGYSFIPSDIFIHSKDIQVGDYRIIKNFLVLLTRAGLIRGRGDQTRRVQRSRHDDELMKEGTTLR